MIKFLSLDFGQQLSGYIRDLDLNVTAETGDLYYVTVKAMNGAGAWSDLISSRPIHVYGANTPGTVLDGRKVRKSTLIHVDGTEPPAPREMKFQSHISLLESQLALIKKFSSYQDREASVQAIW